MTKPIGRIIPLAVIIVLTLGASIGLATDPRYTVDTGAEPIVIDRITGLAWQQSSNAGAGGDIWQSALAHCEGLSFAGNDDWRVPKVTELITLVDEKRAEVPAINPVYFPDFDDNNGYWTSTTSRQNGGLAYVVYFGEQDSTFGRGGVVATNKLSQNFVLCVRGGE